MRVGESLPWCVVTLSSFPRSHPSRRLSWDLEPAGSPAPLPGETPEDLFPSVRLLCPAWTKAGLRGFSRTQKS